MKTILLRCVLFALFLNCSFVFSQTGYGVNLLRSGGSSESFDNGKAVAVDDDGNMYMAGTFSQTATFGSQSVTSAGDVDGYIVKYNPQGVALWAKRVGGTGVDQIRGIAISGTELYVTGFFNGTANFNTPYSFINNNLISAGSSDIFLAKYDLNGTFLWARRGGGTNVDQASGIAVSGADIYITGQFNNAANFNTPSSTGTNEISSIGSTDAFIAKFNSSGVYQFSRRAGSTGPDKANTITTALNGVYIAGEFTGDAHFNTAGIPGTTSLTSAGLLDVFVAKYDFNGNIQWTRRAGGTSNDLCYGITNIGDNVFITGQFLGTANFNTPSATGSNELISAGGTDGFFARFDGNGDFAGGRRFGGTSNDWGTGICRIGTTLYVAGLFEGTANFNQPSAFGSNEIVSPGNSDIFLARFTNQGVFQWANRAGGTSFDNAEAVVALNTEVYVTGRFSTTANFNNPSSGGTNSLTSSGGYDSFLARYSCIPSAPSGSAVQQFCAANNPTVADLEANGNMIKWYMSAIGGAALASNTPLVNGVTIYASQTKNGCESDERFAVNVELLTVIPSPSGNANQFFCNDGSQNLVSSLTASGQNVVWFANPTGGAPLNMSTPLVNGTTYYGSQSIDGCQSTNRLAVTVTISNTPPVPVAASPQNFCTNGIPTLAAVAVSGLNIQWYSTSGTGSPIPLSTSLVNGNNYYVRQTVNGCISPPAVVQVFMVSPPSAPTGSANQSFCASSLPTVSNLAANGTNIQWYSTPSGGSPLAPSTNLVNGTMYYATQSNGNCESGTRLAVTANLTSVPAPAGNVNQEFCGADGAMIQDLVVAGSGIEWFSTPTLGTPLSLSQTLANGNTYYAQQTVSGCVSVSRLAVVVTINNTPAPSGNNPQSFCASTNPLVSDLVAVGTNVQWYSVANGGTPLSPSTPLVNGNYFASQTINGCPSTTRLYVLVDLATIILPPTAANTQNFCSGDNPTLNDINITGTNILWYAASTGGSPISVNTVLVNGTTYYATQTISGCESTSRRAVLVNIFNTPNPPAGNSVQQFCAGSTPTIADLQTIPVAGNWYASASGGSPLPVSTSLVNGQTYYATTSFQGCESAALAVTVNINPVVQAPTGNAVQTFCATAGVIYRVQDLVATGSSINWYYSEVGGSPINPLEVLGSGGTYYASQTINGCESANRLEVVAILNSTPSPAGSPVQFFCSQDNPTLADMVVSGSSIVWYSAGTGGTVLPSSTPLVNGTLYHASQTLNGCPSEFRLGVEAVITTTPSPTGNSVQQFCSLSSPTVADLYTNETNVSWFSLSSGGSPLPSGQALVNGNTYYASQTISGCESITRFPVTVSFISASPAPNGLANQSFCAQDNPTISSINVSGTNIEWFTTPTGGSPISASTALVNGTTYYASQTVSGCPSGTRLGVTVSVNATPVAPTGTSVQSFCSSNLPSISNLVVVGSSIIWYNLPSGGNQLNGSELLVNGVTYYASQTINGCQSINRLAVTVNLTTSPAAPSGTQTQYFCSAESPTIGSLVANGSNITWYPDFNSNTPLSNNTALVDGALYYATQTLNGCESVDRFQALVIINQTPQAPTGNASQAFCSAENPSIADLIASGSNIEWFASGSGGSPLNGTLPLTDATSYFAQQTVNSCSSIQRFEVVVTVNETPDNGVSVNGLTASALESGAIYQWINCANNQPISNETGQSFVAIESGNYAVQITQNGCTALSECVEMNTIGITESEKLVYRLYPNPATNYIVLEGDFTLGNPILRVLDITGKDISNHITSAFGSEGKMILNTEALCSGIYFLIVTTDKGASEIKFFITK